jgi:hypothetical protein
MLCQDLHKKPHARMDLRQRTKRVLHGRLRPCQTSGMYLSSAVLKLDPFSQNHLKTIARIFSFRKPRVTMLKRSWVELIPVASNPADDRYTIDFVGPSSSSSRPLLGLGLVEERERHLAWMNVWNDLLGFVSNVLQSPLVAQSSTPPLTFKCSYVLPPLRLRQP